MYDSNNRSYEDALLYKGIKEFQELRALLITLLEVNTMKKNNNKNYNGFAAKRAIVNNALDTKKYDKHEGGRIVYGAINSDINNAIINISSNSASVNEICETLYNEAMKGTFAPTNTELATLKTYSEDAFANECPAIFPIYIAYNIERLAEGIAPVSIAEVCRRYIETNEIEKWFYTSPYCMFGSYTDWIHQMTRLSRELIYNRQYIIEYEMTYNLLHTYARSTECRKLLPDLLYLLNRKLDVITEKFIDISDNILRASEYMPTKF